MTLLNGWFTLILWFLAWKVFFLVFQTIWVEKWVEHTVKWKIFIIKKRNLSLDFFFTSFFIVCMLPAQFLYPKKTFSASFQNKKAWMLEKPLISCLDARDCPDFEQWPKICQIIKLESCDDNFHLQAFSAINDKMVVPIYGQSISWILFFYRNFFLRYKEQEQE